MKTAVSLPDKVFEDAERHVRRTDRSRSQLYSDAISEYLARHSPDAVTEQMNRIIDRVGEGVDPFVPEASRRALKRTEW